MSGRSQPRGQCIFCGYEGSKAAVTRHLAKCSQRQAQMSTVEALYPDAKTETLWHMRVNDAYESHFWLDLEVRGTSTLGDLDKYLRAIWLECCGHLSQFSIGGWSREEISMRRRIDAVFQPDLELTHIYDFGTSSVTLIKAVKTRVGTPLSQHPIVLMTRNLPPPYLCSECGELATHFCMECVAEGEPATLCAKHARSHAHVAYGEPVWLVNSPRVGMCGYTGPADPPY